MIAVTFALPNESSDFVRLLANNRLHGHELRVVHTGVGSARAGDGVRRFLQQETPRFLISAGFAGAVNDQLAVGDLLLAENFSTPALIVSLEDKLVAVHRGVLATADEIIDSIEDRATLTEKAGAIAVDMETESIARACTEASVPMISLRAISDTPSAPFPIPPVILFNIARQKTEYARLASYLLRHPHSIVRLIRFAGTIKRARKSLTDALDQILRSDLSAL
jgi:nucleoside phosphorylase